ncbi:type IV pilin accessory protein [Acinetobacter junii]|uniref:TfpX/TfpZ family type IV pilin accessory protein n=1 Tax=Acinetobacter junii TaxID=40215 RepID=UPI0024481671|nr:TfpX/TfpZ family type IV pilin accessory protein [Acinetobacter junii]MDH1915962.1 type IV pilin accessory protein [Acinetobacter junii]
MSKRLKFFLSHLSLSFLIALLVVGVVFFIWYPSPLATAVGVTHIFLMLLAIDVIIGPVLGFIVYKEGKKTLKMDLGVIVLLQLSALAYGIFNIAEGRPVWLAYNVDRFELVRNNDIVEEKIAQALPQYQHPSWGKPQYVAVEFAKDSETRNEDMFAEALGGISLAQKPERYVDFSHAQAKIQQRMQPLEVLEQYNEQTVVQAIVKKYPQAIGFVPLKAVNVDMTVLVDAQGDVIKIVDLRPWQ